MNRSGMIKEVQALPTGGVIDRKSSTLSQSSRLVGNNNMSPKTKSIKSFDHIAVNVAFLRPGERLSLFECSSGHTLDARMLVVSVI